MCIRDSARFEFWFLLACTARPCILLDTFQHYLLVAFVQPVGFHTDRSVHAVVVRFHQSGQRVQPTVVSSFAERAIHARLQRSVETFHDRRSFLTERRVKLYLVLF